MLALSPHLTDEATLTALGLRIERHRLDRNLTQAELAAEAGIGKRTLERIEDGAPCQITAFLRILRALDLLENLDLLIPEPSPTPMDLLKAQGKKRRRASKPRTTEKLNEPTWTWGE